MNIKESCKRASEAVANWPQWKKNLAGLKPEKPCGHSGCLDHAAHPCEGCGSVAGRFIKEET